MQNKSSRPDKPGWLFIDRYMSNATIEKQEAAYQNLHSLVHLLFRIDERLITEEKDIQKMLQPPLF